MAVWVICDTGKRVVIFQFTSSLSLFLLWLKNNSWLVVHKCLDYSVSLQSKEQGVLELLDGFQLRAFTSLKLLV